MAAPDHYTADVTDLLSASVAQRRVRDDDLTELGGANVRRRIKVNPFQAGLSSEGLAVPPLQIGLQLPR